MKCISLIRSTLLGPELPSPTTLLFTHPIGGIMQILSRPLISPNNNDEYYDVLVPRQTKMIRTMILPEIMILF